MEHKPKNITASDYKKMRNLVDEFSSPNVNKHSLKFGRIISTGIGYVISVVAFVMHSFKFITSKLKSLAIQKIQVQEPKTLFEE
ncbi:hypothetical protein SAMN05216464_103320 [Mucilaginibacter pineti]|uniref:Uncharacterized protein n=1 Tax=Mucilaginibacter pineti TaxID=1391627 RepID=A0A1G6ZEB2_9SPHI|nr:hypothetical protein [Mucilaginibacter pineti]SDE00910.1 hypothetical protein SAMN05216464_103320 [Mucilaginibacter pineti]